MSAQAASGATPVRGWLRLVRRAAAAVYVWLLAWTAALVVVGTLAGHSPVVVTSGSMQPALRPGDTVLNSPPDEPLYDAPTVITFAREGDGRLVTHRVVGVDEDAGAMITRGDANAQDDSAPVQPDQVVGVARWLVPAAGLPVLWAGQGAWARLAAWALLTVLAVAWAFPREPAPAPESARPMWWWLLTPAEQRVAAAAAVVGLTAVVSLAVGPAWAVVVVGGAGATAAVSRGLRRLLAAPGRPWRPAERAVGAAATVVAMTGVVALLVGAPTTSAAFTASDSNAGNHFTAADPRELTELYLFNTLTGGDSTTQPLMPLRNQPLPSGPMPNYSTENDTRPGRYTPAGSFARWRSEPLQGSGTSAGTATFNWGVLEQDGKGPWRLRLRVEVVRPGLADPIELASLDKNVNVSGQGPTTVNETLTLDTVPLQVGDQIQVVLGGGSQGNERHVDLYYGTQGWPATVSFDTPLLLP